MNNKYKNLKHDDRNANSVERAVKTANAYAQWKRQERYKDAEGTL